MKNISGDTIYIVSRHSNWSEAGVEKAFGETGIQPSAHSWKRLIEIVLLVLGTGLLVAGIIFFFAYNWHLLHRFVKLGIVQGLVLLAVLLAVFTHWSFLVKSVLLTSASLLVGCLFAVFGQVYQTGADAYDFFLSWTVFILLWCIAARFVPLWLLFLILVNITISLYDEQVANHWPDGMVTSILFAVNAVAVLIAETTATTSESLQKWFIRLATLAALCYSTAGICSGILNDYNGDRCTWPTIVLAMVAYPLAIWRSLRTRNLFYLTVVPLSVIIILSAGLFQLLEKTEEAAFLLTGLFIATAVTLLIRQIITLYKTWHDQ